MAKYITYSLLAAVIVCTLPVFWSQACIHVALWAFRIGIVRAEFAPNFGQLLVCLPWVALSFSAIAVGIYFAVNRLAST